MDFGMFEYVPPTVTAMIDLEPAGAAPALVAAAAAAVVVLGFAYFLSRRAGRGLRQNRQQLEQQAMGG